MDWPDEQDIYNDMLWGQGVTLEEARTSQLSFLYPMMPDLDPKNKEANFQTQSHTPMTHKLSWHSSRGIENRLHSMKDVCDRLDVHCLNVLVVLCKLLEQSHLQFLFILFKSKIEAIFPF